MKINAQTKISQILKASPEALESIVALSPKFMKLRNPLLRKIMAPRVNIEEAAKMGGCSAAEFYIALQPFGFVIETGSNISFENNSNKSQEIARLEAKISSVLKPDWLEKISDESEIKYLDVRPLISSGKDPLERIMKTLKEINPDTKLCVINSFEPIPLITLLKQKGYAAYVANISPDEVHTYFKKDICPSAENKEFQKQPKTDETENFLIEKEQFNALTEKFSEKLITIDVRHLDMPLPMITILENLEQLPEEHALYVQHKKVPLYLLPELDERGFEYHICKLEEGNVKLLIRKRVMSYKL